MKVEMLLVGPLEKVFLDGQPHPWEAKTPFEGFQNEDICFQVAYRLTQTNACRDFVTVRLHSPLGDRVRARRVMHVPVGFPTFPDADDDYLRKTPGLYPDLLRELDNTDLRIHTHQWNSLWIDVQPDIDVAPGDYPVEVALYGPAGEPLNRLTVGVRILPGELPALSISHTKWLHCDCIAQYYNVELWSEPFWKIAENFVRRAAQGNINMMLTPIHTPPLDTERGGERLTCQLVDISFVGGQYTFGFDRLRRWVAMCQRAGIHQFEMAHLFTQWGATHTPKIMATVDGEYRRIFGWDAKATGAEYRTFLAAYLPALTRELHLMGIAEHCVFHISDEPDANQLADYMAAKALVAPYLDGFQILDALSDLAFWQMDKAVTPVVATDQMRPFLDAKADGLWAYYCQDQYKGVSNQFIAMPSARARILGAQLYRQGMRGFLHWGFNFYNTQFSRRPIDPYAVTDGDGFGPSGDMFQLYPGLDGRPEDSIRFQALRQAFDDHRALSMLESIAGREAVLQLMDDELDAPIDFEHYPRGAAFLHEMRARVNRAILQNPGSCAGLPMSR